MPSRSLLSVQEKLERRWRYVQEAEWPHLWRAMARYVDFVQSEDALRLVVADLEGKYAQVIRDAHAAAKASVAESLKDPRREAAPEAESAAFALGLLKSAEARRTGTNANFEALTKHCKDDSSRMTLEERARWQCRVLTQSYLRPLHEYLLDALDTNVETLAAIRWFQQWAQWFGASRFEWEKHLEDKRLKTREELDPGGTHAAQYESCFQLTMFEKMYEYGLRFDMIAREPKGADGRPDFVVYKAMQRTSIGSRLTVFEAKLLKSKTNHSTQLGHLQVQRYMNTFGSDTGYVVLFDLYREGHHLDGPWERRDDLPFIRFEGDEDRRVFVVHVPCVSQTSASKADPAPLRATNFKFNLK